jgi:hypothetical protein
MQLRAWYKNKVWDIQTLFLQTQGSTGARLERIDENGVLLVEFPSRGEFVILPSTGLRDKNETLIYRWDVVRYSYMGAEVNQIVEWDDTRAGFTPFIGFQGHNDFVYVDARCVEVVGFSLIMVTSPNHPALTR